MKSWPEPYFRKWKIKVQKIRPSVAGACWKSKKWHKRWKQQCSSVLSMCSKKKLKLWNQNFPRERSTTSFSSHPASAPTSYQCLVGIANAKAKAFNVGISKKKRKNFLRQQLSMLHHAFVAPHPEPKPQRYTLNFTSLGLRLSSHTSLFWTLPEQLFMLHHAFVPTHPEPTTTYLPKMHHKTSGPKIFISHICFELCRYSSPCYTTHVSQPILNQRPKTHYKL